VTGRGALLRIGTRGSPLARTQTAMVCQALAEADPALAAEGAIETVVVRTTGDRVVDRPLAELGGKGLFCKELEAALLERQIDLAVHSMKDLPTWLPDGLTIGAVLAREDPRDVLIARAAAGLEALAAGAVVGSASLRRQAQLLAHRPDLRVVNLRGNVETRLRKLAAGEVDATLLALAGLRRLGIMPAGAVILAPEMMLPAVGQGVIGIECRAGDARTRTLLAALDDPPTGACLRAERALLATLDGSCHTPIAGYAEADGPNLRLRALIARPDGSVCLRAERRGALADGEALGGDAGRELKARAGPGFFD
jgi:hydroxymethylbilane synthase